MALSVPKLLQVLVRHLDSQYIAESLDYPVSSQSEFLGEALDGVEDEIKQYLVERDAWDTDGAALLVSVYLGRFAGQES